MLGSGFTQGQGTAMAHRQVVKFRGPTSGPGCCLVLTCLAVLTIGTISFRIAVIEWWEQYYGVALTSPRYQNAEAGGSVALAFLCLFSGLCWLANRDNRRLGSLIDRALLSIWGCTLSVGLLVGAVNLVAPSLAKARAERVFRPILSRAVSLAERETVRLGHPPATLDLVGLTREVRRRLPAASADGEPVLLYTRPGLRLHYADGLAFEFDADGRVRAVWRGATQDKEANRRHCGRTIASIEALVGPPIHRVTQFDAPWRISLEAEHSFGAYLPGQGSCCSGLPNWRVDFGGPARAYAFSDQWRAPHDWGTSDCRCQPAYVRQRVLR